MLCVCFFFLFFNFSWGIGSQSIEPNTLIGILLKASDFLLAMVVVGGKSSVEEYIIKTFSKIEDKGGNFIPDETFPAYKVFFREDLVGPRGRNHPRWVTAKIL